MTTSSQDFTIYAGDAANVIFTIKDGAGNAIDLSGVTEIEWNAQRDLQTAVVIDKTKTGGAITLVGGGTGGQFKLALTSVDTAPLSNYYIHQARITDSTGNVSTVTLGRMQVGRAPIATYSGDPATSAKDTVRFWVQDTNSPWKIQDAEILYILTQFTNPMLAAANIARSLAAKYAAMPSKRVGDFQISWGELAKNYLMIAENLQAQGQTLNVIPYSGGISRADKAQVRANTDRVVPPFREKQFDNPNAGNNQDDGWDR
jgi:hypothetical protein